MVEAPAAPSEGGGDGFLTARPAVADQIHQNNALYEFEGRQLLAGHWGIHETPVVQAGRLSVRFPGPNQNLWMAGIGRVAPRRAENMTNPQRGALLRACAHKAPDSCTDSPPTTHRQPHDSPNGLPTDLCHPTADR